MDIRGGGRDRIRSDGVCLERMSPVTILGESFAAQLLALSVGAYKFRHARKSLGNGGDTVAKIDQEITGVDGVVTASDCYR